MSWMINNLILKIYNAKYLFLILVAVLLLSLSLFFINRSQQKVVIYYPLDDMENVDGEIRSIPYGKNLDDRITFFIKEMLLHPVWVSLNPISPPGVEINFLIFDKNKSILYLDLSNQLVLTDRKNSNYPDDKKMLEIIKHNIHYRFPVIETINITIDGMVPFD